jgi:Ca2+-binding RTX toxin-like protein
MTSFNIAGFTTTRQSLFGGEVGSIGRNGVLQNSGVSVRMSAGSVLTNLGSVTSNTDSVASISGAAQVVNAGVLSGFAAVLFAGSRTVSTLTVMNTGDILGLGSNADGIRKDSGGLNLHNSGTIQTVGDPGVLLGLGTAARANVIVNSGLIANTNANGRAIQSGGDVETVTNTGSIVGRVTLGSGNDLIRGSGSYVGDVGLEGGNDTADLRGGVLTGRLFGGGGNDTLTASAGDEQVDGGDGNDLVRGGAGVDTLDGGRGSDNLQGQAGADELIGGEGTDILAGGEGADVLTGGAGRDTMSGGEGADVFVFNAISETPIGVGDLIDGFRRGEDRIDVNGIDARANQSGQQDFAFIGSSAFTQTGQLRVVSQGQSVRVEMNTEGTNAADAAIVVRGGTTLDIGDFLL